MISIVIASNQPVVRAGLQFLISKIPDYEIVGEAETFGDLKPLVSQCKPHVLLLSLRFPGSSPVRVMRWVRLHSHRTSTIVLVEQDLDAYFLTLMDTGAVGILNAETPVETLEWSISQAISGESLYSEDHLARAAEWHLAAGEKWERLSPRQKLILSLLGKGVKREEIAQRYEISLRTVNFHIGNITKKLKFKSLLEAVCWLHKYFPDDFETIIG